MFQKVIIHLVQCCLNQKVDIYLDVVPSIFKVNIAHEFIGTTSDDTVPMPILFIKGESD